MGVMGACFGSFAALIIYRLPKEQSIVFPRSYCESCGLKLLSWQNIPIFSWVILRARCFFCQKKISPRSTLIELIMAFCLAGLYVRYGIGLVLVEKFIFVFLIICLAYIDLDTFFLPFSLLFYLLLLGIISCILYVLYPATYVPLSVLPGFLKMMVINKPVAFSLIDKLAGAFVGALFLSLLNVIATFILRKTKRLSAAQWAMGWGDPILVFAIGLFVGLSHLVLVLFLASALGSICGILNRFSKIAFDDDESIVKDALPYGPFLAIAATYVYIC